MKRQKPEGYIKFTRVHSRIYPAYKALILKVIKLRIICLFAARLRGMPLPIPVGRQQGVEPGLSAHPPPRASEGSLWHPNGGAPAGPQDPRPAGIPAAPSGGGGSGARHGLVLPQPRATEEAAPLRQVGEPGVYHGQGDGGGQQTNLRVSGVGEYCRVLRYFFFPCQASLTYSCFRLSLSSPKDNQRLQKANETLRKKLKEAEREMERLKTMLKRHALHPVEEDSSS